MNIIWDEPKSMVSGHKPAHIVEPYEDWEQATRNPNIADGARIWKPVFVELTRGVHGDYTSSIKALVKFMVQTDKGQTIQHDPDFLPVVVNIIVGELTGENVERFTRFFLYRPEGQAYETVPECESLHIGVGFPISDSLASATMGALDTVFRGAKRYARNSTSGEMPSEVRHHYVLDRSLGDKVVTGIVDDVVAVANERFRIETGDANAPFASRFEHYWQQSWDVARNGSAIEFGRSLNGADLSADMNDVVYDGAVDEIEFYRRLHANRGKRTLAVGNLIDPNFARPLGFNSSHGTQVTDLAAGCPIEEADESRPIMFVQLPQLASAETWGGRLELFILSGLIRMLRWADNWKDSSGEIRRVAVVINISYEVFADAKDGTGFLEREIGRLARQRNAEGVATAVVLPSGNGFRERCQALMKLPRGEQDYVSWQIQPEDQSMSFIEIWLDQLNRATLTVTGPGGEKADLKLTRSEYTEDNGTVVLPSYTVDRKRQITGRGDFLIARAYVRRFEETSKTRIVLAFAPSLNHENRGQTVPVGAYKLQLTNEVGAPLHAAVTVQRDDTPRTFPRYARQSYLDHPGVDGVDPETEVRDMPLWTVGPVTRLGTLSAYACGSSADVYVVGGAYDRDSRSTAALYSAAGPTDGREAPDLSAITEETRAHGGLMTAGTYSGSTSRFRGTSAAAPQVTRQVVNSLASGSHPDPDFSKHSKSQAMEDMHGSQTRSSPPDTRLGVYTLPLRAEAGRKPRREFRS